MLKKIIESLNFVKGFVRHPKEIGAIIPSSSFLSKEMLKDVNFYRAAAIAEYGCGTGAFTRDIVNNLQPQTKFIGLEINKGFYKSLKAILPSAGNVYLYNNSAENIRQICKNENITYLDYVICALPWANFNSELQLKLLQSTIEHMSKDGTLINFSYLHSFVLPTFKHFTSLLESHFLEVSFSKIIWRNIPPAIVVTARGLRDTRST